MQPFLKGCVLVQPFAKRLGCVCFGPTFSQKVVYAFLQLLFFLHYISAFVNALRTLYHNNVSPHSIYLYAV